MTASPLLRRYRVTRAGAKASLDEALRARDLLLIAEDSGRVAAMAWVITTRALDRSAYLRLLLVDGQDQSRGLGARLVARAEREARASGSRHLALLVTRSNRRARSFYERLGYARVGELESFVRPGITECLYIKSWRNNPRRPSSIVRSDGRR